LRVRIQNVYWYRIGGCMHGQIFAESQQHNKDILCME
jgi:hypothetical protein